MELPFTLCDLITRGLLWVSRESIAPTSGMSCHFEGTSVLSAAVWLCGAKGQCIVAHSVAPVNLCAAAHDWASRFPFVKSFCLVFIIYSTSLKHEMWLGARPSQLCNRVSSKCAVCGSCSVTSSLKSEWCLLHMALCPGKTGWGLCVRINIASVLGDDYSTGLMFVLSYMLESTWCSGKDLVGGHLNKVFVSTRWILNSQEQLKLPNSTVLQTQLVSDLEGSLLMTVDRLGVPLYGSDIFSPVCQDRLVW